MLVGRHTVRLFFVEWCEHGNLVLFYAFAHERLPLELKCILIIPESLTTIDLQFARWSAHFGTDIIIVDGGGFVLKLVKDRAGLELRRVFVFFRLDAFVVLLHNLFNFL